MEDEMIHVGDEVVIMSAPGRFRVIAIDRPTIIIESPAGIRKPVLEQSVRVLKPRIA
jgi:hypothetical protein